MNLESCKMYRTGRYVEIAAVFPVDLERAREWSVAAKRQKGRLFALRRPDWREQAASYVMRALAVAAETLNRDPGAGERVDRPPASAFLPTLTFPATLNSQLIPSQPHTIPCNKDHAVTNHVSICL